MPDSGRLFIVAAPNAGKTFLALAIAKSAAEVGRPTFLVLEEGGARAVGQRFRDLAFPPSAPISIAHLQGFQLRDARARRELTRLLKEHLAPVVALDPFSSLFMGDENETRAMNAAKAELEELARANEQALLVLLHHTSKAGERGEGPSMYAARGSSILSGWADVQLNLTHEPTEKGAGRVSFRVEVAKSRDGERGQRVRATLALGEGTIAFEAMKDDASRVARTEEVRRHLQRSENPLSKNEIHKRVGGNRQDTLAFLGDLEAEGKLVKQGRRFRWSEEAQEGGEP